MKSTERPESVGSQNEEPFEESTPLPAVSTGPGSVAGFCALPERIHPYHQHLDDLAGELASQGTLGLILLDFSALGLVELKYGVQAYREVRQRLLELIAGLAGRMYRYEDILTLDEPGGLRFMLFLKAKRKRGGRLTATDLRALRDRVIASLQPSVARVAFPYLTGSLRIDLGYSLALQNPLLDPKRILERVFQDALDRASHERRAEQFLIQERLQEIISGEKVLTGYQPIMRIRDRSVIGFEALSRGPQGSGLESAAVLFEAAREHNLLVELDRVCRRWGLERSSRFSSHAKIFINTLPLTIRDPEFRGKPLIDFLDRISLSPERIVIEISEKLVIENYSLFEDTMTYFTDLGMRFAVDDLGAGYSGLEAVARLKPTFLKVDQGLVRDVNASPANQEMLRAILSMGRGIGATVIAEGIQTEDEAGSLQAIGVEYGQGYYLARPFLVSDPET